MGMRKQEALDTAKFVEVAASRTASWAAPRIISGDLNSESGIPEMDVLSDCGYTSASQTASKSKADFTTWDPANPQVALQLKAGPERQSTRGHLHGLLQSASTEDPGQLDHIFFKSASGPKLKLLECKVVLKGELEGVVPSDHYGLLADFALSR